MTTFAPKNSVRHKRDRALGIGEVAFVQDSAGTSLVGVRWPTGGLREHPAEDLELVRALIDRLRPENLGPATLAPFALRTLGRWFEARHALTGELSNQPFQMLPHQVIVANRVVNSAPDNRRWLIADDVGLGKTIEAGMILEVLRQQKLGRFRCLIVTPAGLCPQWAEEMKIRFHRNFKLFSSTFVNDLEEHDFLIASIDTIRAQKFKQPLADVTPWDLVIVDEAHHLATEKSVQRYDLMSRVRELGKARNLLFLTATPHSGNVKHFTHMLQLLREDLFPDVHAVTEGKENLNLVMIRNRKSEVCDTRGDRIFKGVAPAQIIGFKPTSGEVEFFESLMKYLKEGYGTAAALKEKQDRAGSAVGFVMSTFQKLASSSRGAIGHALANRLKALEGDDLPGDATNPDTTDDRYEGENDEKAVATATLAAADGKKGKKVVKGVVDNEAAQVKGLLRLLKRLDQDDSKLTQFLSWVKATFPADVKILIFTEYRGTQSVLVAGLEKVFGAGTVTSINGSMLMDARKQHVHDFNENTLNPRFLVSTEAGGEGLNMQKSCHVIVNYDLPWNPMRLQQRIGRVYRYGQHKQVQIYNIKTDSQSAAFADQRIEKYLRAKVQEITGALAAVQGGNPEDIEGEVIGQVASSMSINDLYQEAIIKGEEKAQTTIDRQGAEVVERIKKDGLIGLFKGLKHFDLGDYEKAAAKVTTAQLDYFVRKYLATAGAKMTAANDLLGFVVPKSLKDVAERIAPKDAYEAKDILGDKVERATVNKEFAQTARDCRLLRFGDIAFEAMVRHVQDADYSDGVTSLDLPATALGWKAGDDGVCVLFDLKIIRQEGSAGGARILRQELLPILVPRNGEPRLADDLFTALPDAQSGPLTIDPQRVRAAYELARKLAEASLTRMREDVVNAYKTSEGIVPQMQDFAAAWVRAT